MPGPHILRTRRNARDLTAGETEAERELQEAIRLARSQIEREENGDRGPRPHTGQAREYLGYIMGGPPPGPRRGLPIAPHPPRGPRRGSETAGPVRSTLRPGGDLATTAIRAVETAARRQVRSRFVTMVRSGTAERRRLQQRWLRRRHNETAGERQRREEDVEDYEEVQQVLEDVRGSVDLSFEGQMALLDAMGYAEEMYDS